MKVLNYRWVSIKKTYELQIFSFSEIVLSWISHEKSSQSAEYGNETLLIDVKPTKSKSKRVEITCNHWCKEA